MARQHHLQPTASAAAWMTALIAMLDTPVSPPGAADKAGHLSSSYLINALRNAHAKAYFCP